MTINDLELTEFQPFRLPQSQLLASVAELIYRRYDKQISVQFPSPKTGNEWELTAKGYVGVVRIDDAWTIRLLPKTSISSVFAMLEYAYKLDLEFQSGLVPSTSLEEFYERLALTLAKRVLDRVRKGLHRDYRRHDDQLPYVRGTIDLNRALRAPWQTNLACEFDEHTADIEDNQILGWTLELIARARICSAPTLAVVRRAYRVLRDSATIQPLGPATCDGRLYTRLTADYHPLHALCKFFLATTGPGYQSGSESMLPFLIEMGSLFEAFVAEWMKTHMPPELRVRAQEKISFEEDAGFKFRVDLVVRDRAGKVLAVLDTKYKTPYTPEASDVAQVVAYAESLGSNRGFLIYPSPIPKPLDILIGSIRVTSVVFDLAQDIEHAGSTFLNEISSDLIGVAS